MKNKVTLAISTLVLCSSVSVAEAAKHHNKYHSSTAHKTSHHTKHHNKHSHHIAGHRHKIHYYSNVNPYFGVASYYSTRFQGRKTASGEPYDMNELTAAHRSLPLGSYAEVTNVDSNRTIVVRINDRGPFHGNRILDLSSAAAEELGMVGGTSKVKITPLAANEVEEVIDVADNQHYSEY